MHIGILGGGISGVTLQRALHHSSEVLEIQDAPGGLCRTYWKDGFGWDIGGHILFSKNQQINQMVDDLLGDNINRCRRANKVLFKGRYVKYPFENDLAALEKQDCYECLIDYLKADFPKPTSLAEWAYYTFGQSIADKYLIPYNHKIWKLDPREMGVEWVERIPRPPMEDVVKSAIGIETEGYTHQLFFRYPLRGGAEALVQAIARGEKANVTCNAGVRSIRRSGAGWTIEHERGTGRYDHVVIAFPIHEAIRCLEGVPEAVQRAVAGLRYNAIRIAMIAVNNESLMDKSAVYIPDPSVLPHRVCYMGFFSPHMVRPGTSSLIAEVTSYPGDETDRISNDGVVERSIADLDRVGIISRRDVVATDVKRFPYAYPVYDKAYLGNVKIMRDWFADQGISLLGRFAEFEYINSDECLRRALALADGLNARG